MGRTPTYSRIAEIIEERIRDKAIPEGAILLEGPIAAIFRSSRSPVKQALQQLQEAGLVRRFEGRGLVVGKAPPRRFRMTAETLGVDEGDLPGRGDPLGTLYYSIEREIILHSLRGSPRVIELALARRHGIGRASARDILVRAQQAGVVVKDENAHWRIVPLDEERCINLYDLRILLEPVALVEALPHLQRQEIWGMHERLVDALGRFPAIGVEELDRLEADLHVTAIGRTRNIEIARALRRTHPTHIAGKHLQLALGGEPNVDPFMAEHLDVVDALAKGRGTVVRDALLSHLKLSKEKVVERLSSYLALHRPEPVDYILD